MFGDSTPRISVSETIQNLALESEYQQIDIKEATFQIRMLGEQVSLNLKKAM